MASSGYDVPDLDLQYRHSPLLETGFIRILVVPPSENIGDPIQCDIEVAPLDRVKSLYVALSYTWGMEADGDASFNRGIIIGGKPMAVTQNLFECLRRVRHRTEPLKIWIDAICINQTDDDEKASQVANMAEVYANAQSTIVWLGEHDRNGNDAEIYALLKCLSAGEHRQHNHKEHSWRDIDGQAFARCDAVTSRMKDLSRGQTNEIVVQILQFLKRRYFTRRWIVQELRMSGEVMFHWNRYCMSLQEIMRALKTLRDFSLYCESGMDKYSARIHSELQVIMVKRNRLLKADTKMSLLELLMDCSENECSDPRDRLFALVSLDREVGITPDYSASFTKIYTDFAKLLVSGGHIEAVFRNLRSKREDIVEGLPSWVPDLRYPFSAVTRDHQIDRDLNVCIIGDKLSFEAFQIGQIMRITPVDHSGDGAIQLTVRSSIEGILQYTTYFERESEDAAHLFKANQTLFCNYNGIENDADAHQMVYLTEYKDLRSIIRTFSGSTTARTFWPMLRPTGKRVPLLVK